MKMRRDHVIPLNKQAINILELMKPISGHTKFIFPTLKAPFNKPMNKETVNTVLYVVNNMVLFYLYFKSIGITLWIGLRLVVRFWEQYLVQL